MSTAIAPTETLTAAQLDTLCINTIRTLSIDAVQQANSGHPGTPMALAPLVYTIWNRALKFDPQDPIWPNRDRFVLSNGHASMLLWSILHLTGVQAVNADYETVGHPSVTLDDIRHFRQLGSKAPGHPEYHWVSGVETTTGPLGQGTATSVGMAIAEKWLAHRYNRPGFDIFDYNIYTICGDGCLMEGISSEAASLAGHLGLDNLCWIYDNNHITIEGNTRLAFTEDVQTRFIAYGWNVLRVGDANDVDRIEQALEVFRKTKGRPTFIVLDSHIGYGSPHKQDTAAAHGEPLGEDEVRLCKRAYGFPEDAKFFVPDGVYDHFNAGIGKRGADARQKWAEVIESYRTQYPDLAVEVELMQKRELPTGWDRNLPVFPADAKGVAGRDASGKTLNVLAQNIPWFLGGSADLGPSNKTLFTYPGAGDFQADTPEGKILHFGIREHAMAAIVNGLNLSKVRAFGASFFIFSDYARPAIRLASLMELPSMFIFTHDAMGDGEDGPTHQPIEQLISLRAIPGLITIRPGDANEVVEAYRFIMQLRHQPAVLALSRQPLPTLDRKKYAPPSGVSQGAYVLADAPGGNPEVIIIASGSEVSLAVFAHEKLIAEGIRSRVVSMPSWEIFEQQPQAYRDSVLLPNVKARVAVEQGSILGWDRYVGNSGHVIGMNTFGASAPLKELQKKFGFEPDLIVAAAKEQLGRN
ncbi:MAG TPA: transketolase [Terriglobales bacterium]|nr:transketolase [Terriglobales bacterium]